MAYICKTYQGENKRYLRSISYDTLKRTFMNNVDHEYTFEILVEWLSNNNPKLLQQFIIKILSNPDNYTIADLEELLSQDKQNTEE